MTISPSQNVSSNPNTHRPLNEFVVIESNSNQPQNFVIGNCLKCQALVKVSAIADPESLVKCPRCSEKFKLYSVLDQFVPELELVEESEPEEIVPRADMSREYGDNSDKPKTKFVVPKQLAAGARKRRKRKRRRERSSSESSNGSSSSRSRRSNGAAELLVVDDSARSSSSSRSMENSSTRSSQSGSSSDGSSRSGASSSRSSARSGSSKSARKKTKTTSAETLKIVTGGLLALPLAYMLLFWVFHRDPLNLAPMIHSTFPSAVPEVLIPESELEQAAPVEENLDEERLPIPELDPDNIQGNPDLGF